MNVNFKKRMLTPDTQHSSTLMDRNTWRKEAALGIYCHLFRDAFAATIRHTKFNVIFTHKHFYSCGVCDEL